MQQQVRDSIPMLQHMAIISVTSLPAPPWTSTHSRAASCILLHIAWHVEGNIFSTSREAGEHSIWDRLTVWPPAGAIAILIMELAQVDVAF